MEAENENSTLKRTEIEMTRKMAIANKTCVSGKIN